MTTSTHTLHRSPQLHRSSAAPKVGRVPRAPCVLPNAEEDEIERQYNRRVAGNNGTYALMDRNLIRYPDPRSPVEFCDLYSTDREIIHIKPYAGSSTLSHLFAQGVTSGTLFAHDAGFRRAVNERLPVSHRLQHPQQPLAPKEYSVVYAIISGSQRPSQSHFLAKSHFTAQQGRFEVSDTTSKSQKLGSTHNVSVSGNAAEVCGSCRYDN